MKKLLIILLISVLFLVSCSNSSESQVTDTTTTTKQFITNSIEDITEITEETTTEEEESDTILNYVLNEDKTFNEEKVKEFSTETYKSNFGQEYYVLYELETTSPIFVAFMKNDDLKTNVLDITSSPFLMLVDYSNIALDEHGIGSMYWWWADKNDGELIAAYSLLCLPSLEKGFKDYLKEGITFKSEEYKKYCDENDINYKMENLYATIDY